MINKSPEVPRLKKGWKTLLYTKYQITYFFKSNVNVKEIDSDNSNTNSFQWTLKHFIKQDASNFYTLEFFNKLLQLFLFTFSDLLSQSPYMQILPIILGAS